MPMRLENKVVVITGAGAGLGRQSALLFASEGAAVVLGDIDPDRAEDTRRVVAESGGEAVAAQVDVSDESQVRALVDAGVETYGKLDVMYNNAGVAMPGNGTVPFEEISEDVWQRQIGVNLSGVFYGCKAAVGALRQNGGGSIINTSSAGGLAVSPGWAVYGAAKGGVNTLTKGLAVELGQFNIRVNAMCPLVGMSLNFLQAPGSSLVDEEEMARSWDAAAAPFPLHAPRPPQVIDHAQLALFLASDESAYLTGQLITIDGGLFAKLPYPSWQGKGAG